MNITIQPFVIFQRYNELWKIQNNNKIIKYKVSWRLFPDVLMVLTSGLFSTGKSRFAKILFYERPVKTTIKQLKV